MVECIICYETITEDTGSVRLKCKHEYCPQCFAKHMRVSNQCAMCRKNVTDVPHPPKDPPARTEADLESDLGIEVEASGDIIWETDTLVNLGLYNRFFLSPGIVGQVIERTPTPVVPDTTPISFPTDIQGAYERWNSINESNISIFRDIFSRNT